jgi:indolepyruvate ferredoxin oxidoreductase alpha subunit
MSHPSAQAAAQAVKPDTPPADTNEQILLGDEAVARGAIDAGISAAYAYPGTPSTEIFQTIQNQSKALGLSVRGLWSTNEKVAMEEGVGVSYAGKRAMVSMKHVGLNVAADPFMNAAVAGAHGGLVVVVADDPGMHSSQNEQDSRYFADFAMVPCLEPADQQQCYDFTREAFELSERLQVPVMLRLVTRLAHSRAAVRASARRAPNDAHWVPDPDRFTLIPVNARRAYASLVDKQAGLQAWSAAHAVNQLTIRGQGLPGILVSGIAWNYLIEALGDQLAQYNVLRIGAYPLPVDKMRALLDASIEIRVIEEGYPFIERYVSALSLMREHRILGKMTGDLPRMGELSQDAIRRCFGLALAPTLQLAGLGDVLVGRPPRLCDKCPHTDAYIAIKEVVAELGDNVRVMGDIGCYSLGTLEPLRAIHSCS